MRIGRYLGPAYAGPLFFARGKDHGGIRGATGG